MNRRNFLKALTITATGIAVPELIVPEKRFWALDRTMMGEDIGHLGSIHPHVQTITIANPGMIHPDDEYLLLGGREIVSILGVHDDGSIVIGRGPGVYTYDQIGTLENVSWERKY